MALIVSGGHTELIYIKKEGQYKILGKTLDDAAAHTNTSSENLYKAIQDKSKKVRMAAAKNKNATKEHVLAALEMAHKEL
jgi:tRNA A37 threonylcarbamoyltransferase TsaD